MAVVPPFETYRSPLRMGPVTAGVMRAKVSSGIAKEYSVPCRFLGAQSRGMARGRVHGAAPGCSGDVDSCCGSRLSGDAYRVIRLLTRALCAGQGDARR